MKMLAFLLSQNYDAAVTAKKRLLKQTKQREQNSFTNTVAKTDIDDLKI